MSEENKKIDENQREESDNIDGFRKGYEDTKFIK